MNGWTKPLWVNSFNVRSAWPFLTLHQKKLPEAQYITAVPSVAKIVTRTWIWGMIIHDVHLYSLFLSFFALLSLFLSDTLALPHSSSFFLCLFFGVSLSHWCLSFAHTQIYVTRFRLCGWELISESWEVCHEVCVALFYWPEGEED